MASWDTIDATNSAFYVIEQLLGGASDPRGILLSKGPHDLDSLSDARQTAVSGIGKAAGLGTYSVTRVSRGSGGVTSRAYQISCTVGEFRLPSDWQI